MTGATGADAKPRTVRSAAVLTHQRPNETGEGTRFLTSTAPERGPLYTPAAVDLLLLECEGTVLTAVHSLPRREGARVPEIHSVVELPAGTLARLETRVGDVVEMYRRYPGERSETA